MEFVDLLGKMTEAHPDWLSAEQLDLAFKACAHNYQSGHSVCRPFERQ